MTRRPLPFPVRRLIRCLTPARTVESMIADLEDDYASIRERGSAWMSRWWLLKETASLTVTYARARWLSRGGTRFPLRFIRDARFVLRGMRGRWLASVGAAVILSSGLFALMLTAGLASALLFQPVSAVHGTALLRLTSAGLQGTPSGRFSYRELEVIRERIAPPARLVFVNLQPVLFRAGATVHQTLVEVVSGDYSEVVGAQILIGRGLGPADDRRDSPRVAVIASPLWRDRFDSSPSVLGKSILLNSESYAIVGVAGSLGSGGLISSSVDVWVPTAHGEPLLGRTWRTDAASRWFIAYLLPSAPAGRMQAELDASTRALAGQFPDHWRERQLRTAPAVSLFGSQRRIVALLVSMLGAFAVLILAVASANVGGLLLARAVAARREAAIHLTLGLARVDLVRRFAFEGGLVGLTGAVLALALYAWVRTQLEEVTLLPTLALRLDLPFDASAAAVVVALGGIAGSALALGPAVWAARVNLTSALADAGSRSSAGRIMTRTRHVMVASQVALSLVLIVGAALFARSVNALEKVSVGFARSGLVAVDFDVEPSGVKPASLPALAREALDRIAALPGVSGAAMSNRAPADPSTPTIGVQLVGDPTVIADVTMNLVTEGYFETLGLPIVTGRGFTRAESDAQAGVVVVNETLAARLWPQSHPIGSVLELTPSGQRAQVIGIARDSRYRALSESAQPHVYQPTAPTLGLALLARTPGEPRLVLQRIQQTLDRVGPGLVGFFPRTFDDHITVELLPVRAAARAGTTLGLVAVVLSAVGLYGLVASFVELRRREMGIRLALGATGRQVRSLVVSQALRTAMPGMIVGLVLAGLISIVGRAAFFGVMPFDPAAFAVGIGALAVIVLAASYLPSRRASRVDPATTLRT